jgi:hypothetical protein
MVSYKCEKCCKKFSHKSDYIRHTKRKVPCKSSEEQEKNSKLQNIEVGEVVTVGGKFKCYYCDLTFDDLNLLERHCKLQCKCNKLYNSIYKFDITKLGKEIFGTEDCGEVYVLKNNFDVENVYKIGITQNLRKRITQYRCGIINEPALIYYFPCKDIYICDDIMKVNLSKLKVKREIYKGDLTEIKRILEVSLESVNNGKVYCFESEFKERDVRECTFCKRIFCSKESLYDHTIKCTAKVEIEGEQDNEKKNKIKYICIYCNVIFSTNSNMNKHVKIYKVKKQQDNDKEDLLQKLIEEMKKQSEKMDKMNEIIKQNNEEISKLKTENIRYVQNNNTNIAKQLNQQNIINGNINLLAFGKEDMTHIVDEVYKKILNKGFKSVPTFVEYVHFNKKKPENHNVYISNMQTNYALVFDGDDWKLKERDDILQQLIDEKTEILSVKFNELVAKLDEHTIRKFQRFLNQSDEGDVISRIKGDLKLLLYNNKKIPEGTRELLESKENNKMIEVIEVIN